MNNNLIPPIIPGIFLYCDRWCEKCAFTSSCEAFSSPGIEKGKDEKKLNDQINGEFWEELEKVLPIIEKWIIEKATKESRSLKEFNLPKQKKNFDLFQRDAKSNAILKAGRLYEDMVDDWFDEGIEKLGLIVVETEQGAVIRMPELEMREESINLNQVFEVILRYQLQIYLKLSRSFYSRGREEEEGKETVKVKDSLGAAKSTLALLDRSMAGWGMVLEVLPASEDLIFEILVLLQRLRYNIMIEFSEVRSFVRPGFDD